MENIQAHIHTTEEGRVVLFFTEPDGDDTIIHMVTYVQGVGQADMKLSGPDSAMEKVWASMEEDLFVRSAAYVVKSAKELEELG